MSSMAANCRSAVIRHSCRSAEHVEDARQALCLAGELRPTADLRISDIAVEMQSILSDPSPMGMLE
jgi:hypothetical protein